MGAGAKQVDGGPGRSQDVGGGAVFEHCHHVGWGGGARFKGLEQVSRKQAWRCTHSDPIGPLGSLGPWARSSRKASCARTPHLSLSHVTSPEASAMGFSLKMETETP